MALTDSFSDAVDDYKARFDDSPPHYVFFELRHDEATERMQEALRSGQKLPDLIPPDDIVV